MKEVTCPFIERAASSFATILGKRMPWQNTSLFGLLATNLKRDHTKRLSYEVASIVTELGPCEGFARSSAHA